MYLTKVLNTIQSEFLYMITVRNNRFDFKKLPKKYYYTNKFMMHFLNALSVTFPGGEDFFVRSVRHYRTIDKNVPFEKEISAFIGQEAYHSLAHKQLNEYAQQFGIPALKVEKYVDKSLKYIQQHLSAEICLAATIALEHYTATMAEELLTNKRWLEQMDPEFVKLWKWHSLEEIEHKHVAFQVWKNNVDNNILKNLVMIITSIILWNVLLYLTFMFMYYDNNMTTFEKIDQSLLGLWRLFGAKGFCTNVFKHIPKYFKSDFTP